MEEMKWTDVVIEGESVTLRVNPELIEKYGIMEISMLALKFLSKSPETIENTNAGEFIVASAHQNLDNICNPLFFKMQLEGKDYIIIDTEERLSQHGAAKLEEIN